MNKSYSKQISNREVNGSVNAAQTKNDVREFLHAALQGDAETQCYLGAMYANGDGVPKDSAPLPAPDDEVSRAPCESASAAAYGSPTPRNTIAGAGSANAGVDPANV